MTERLRVREIDDDEGRRLPRIVRRGSGSVVTWRRAQRAAASNAEISYTPANASWLNRIEAQLTALRYVALDGTDHASHPRAGQHDPPLHHLAQQRCLCRCDGNDHGQPRLRLTGEADQPTAGLPLGGGKR